MDTASTLSDRSAIESEHQGRTHGLRRCAQTKKTKVSFCSWSLVLVLGSMGLMPAVEGQVVPEAKKLPHAAPAVPAATGAEGRRHPSYQVFAAQASLPPISPTAKNVIDIGGRVRLDLGLKLSSSQMTLLAEQFAVPVAVLERFQTHWLTNALVDTDQLVRELRTTIIDYRYLETRWTTYHPSPDGEKGKREALSALKAGDIETAWRMYEALPKPAPPSGLKISAQ